ncbi:hypothetical protein [Citrobacter portucalensis]|uniref:hypothetical protein n=1 Tax=Citrobacter portucalensis TaxID=1639133 RepID=UPI002112F16F|nr:hypothetical protein [Citrobacter portucalensis]MCQ6311659.1 hypothetical protein [Citrobacter portucalensis]
MKKILPLILSILSFSASAQTAQEFVNSFDLQSKTDIGNGTIIMMLACKADQKNINAVELNTALQKHYKGLNWRPVDFDQYIDAGFNYADENPNATCEQIAIKMLDSTIAQ